LTYPTASSERKHTVDVTELRELIRGDYIDVMGSLSQTLKNLETAVRSAQDVLTRRPSDMPFGQIGDIVDLALRAQQEWSSAQTLWAAMRGTWWD
jgi:hypothetical protein